MVSETRAALTSADHVTSAAESIRHFPFDAVVIGRCRKPPAGRSMCEKQKVTSESGGGGGSTRQSFRFFFPRLSFSQKVQSLCFLPLYPPSDFLWWDQRLTGSHPPHPFLFLELHSRTPPLGEGGGGTHTHTLSHTHAVLSLLVYTHNMRIYIVMQGLAITNR